MFPDTEAASDATYAHADCHWNAQSYSHSQTDSTPTTTLASHAYANCYWDAECYSNAHRFTHRDTEAASDPAAPPVSFHPSLPHPLQCDVSGR